MSFFCSLLPIKLEKKNFFYLSILLQDKSFGQSRKNGLKTSTKKVIHRLDKTRKNYWEQNRKVNPAAKIKQLK